MTTILVIDDNAHFRAQVRVLLEAEGFAVVGEAEDGASGLLAARSLRPNVVLLDIGLPDIDGFEVADALAADERSPHVVLTSSREAAAYGARLSACPALGFVPKDELSGSAIRALVGGTP